MELNYSNINEEKYQINVKIFHEWNQRVEEQIKEKYGEYSVVDEKSWVNACKIR